MMRVVRRVYPANEDTEHQRDGQQDQREHGELAEGAAHELICFTPMNLVARRPIGEPTRRRRHVFPASKDSRCGAEEHGRSGIEGVLANNGWPRHDGNCMN